MTMETIQDNKLYYSIAEVAKMFGVEQSALRFWEKQFKQISPKTNARGVRQYRKEDIATIGLIHHLIKEKGMTIQGVQKRLAANKDGADKSYEVVNRLKKVKEELLRMRKALDGITPAENGGE
jgi:DNA-binding transcriptional MerR regulator